MNLFKSPISPEWFHYRLCVCICVMELRRGLPCAEFAFRTFSFPCQSNVATHRIFFSLCTQTADVTIWYLHVPTPEICGTMLGLHFSGCFFLFLAIFFQNHTETQRQVVETLLLEFFCNKFGFIKAFTLNSTLETLFQNIPPKIQAQAVIKWQKMGSSHLLAFFCGRKPSRAEEVFPHRTFYKM